MKSFIPLSLVFVFAGGSIAACSSNPTSNTAGNGGTSSAGDVSSAGSGVAVAGSSTTGGSGNTSLGGAATSAAGSGTISGGGTASGGSTTMGGSPAAGGNAPIGGTASAGAPGGGTGGASGGDGAGGTGPLPPYVATCALQQYTPTATPGASCKTKMVPEEQLIASFETAGPAPGWGVYPNIDGDIGFTPTTATPSKGGANGTTQALAFKVVSLPQGIKIQVGFGSQCQDVRTLKGLTFWAKGSIEGATQPFIITANTLIVQLGSEKSLLGGCEGAGCSAAPPDKRVTISAEWREYRIPFDCFGDGKVFDGYFTNILFNAFGPNSSFAIDEVAYY
jgi:hypothetical protein